MPKNQSYWAEKAEQEVKYGALKSVSQYSLLGKFAFWKHKITVSNRSIVVKKTKWLTIISFAIFIVLMGLAFSTFSSQISIRGNQVISNNISDIFKFTPYHSIYNESLWTESINAALETVKITVIGTLMGVVIAIPTAFLSARNISKRYFNIPVRFIAAIFRTIPPLIFVIIFATGFSASLAATLTLLLFSWATMNKLLYEEIENNSLEAYNALIATGSTRISAFRQTILRKLAPKYVSLVLYAFEINIRLSAIFGIVGGINGIGSTLRNLTDVGAYVSVGIPLTILLVTVLLIELLASLLRVFIFEKKHRAFDAEAIAQFSTEREYRLNALKHRYAKKMARTQSASKRKFYQKVLTQKMRLVELSAKLLPAKVVHEAKTAEIKLIHQRFEKKRNEAKRNYQKRLDRANKHAKSRKAAKLSIALKQLLLDLETNEHKEVTICMNALATSKQSYFVYQRRPKDWISYALLGAGLIALVAWAGSQMSWVLLNAAGLNTNLSYIFNPNGQKMGQAFSETLQSLLLAFAATVLGGVAAIIVGALASRKISHFTIAPLFQIALILIRVVPAFFLARIVVTGLVDAQFAAVLALGVHSIGMLGKLIKEQFDTADYGPTQALIANGSTRFTALRFGLLPQVSPHIVSTIIYRFEINIKSMTEVGFISTGISAMGWNLQNYIVAGRDVPAEYANAYAYIWAIIVIVVIVEFCSNIVRSYLVTGLLPWWLYRIIKTLRRRAIIKQAILLHTLRYDVAKMTGQEITLFANLEAKAYWEKNVLIMQKAQSGWTELLQLEAQIYNLQISHSFSAMTSQQKKTLKSELKLARKHKQTLTHELNHQHQAKRQEFKLQTKASHTDFGVLRKKNHTLYKRIYAQYRQNINQTRKLARLDVQTAAHALHNLPRDASPSEILQRRQELKLARKQAIFLKAEAKRKPINNFF